MKKTTAGILRCAALVTLRTLLLLALPAAMQAQDYTYTTNNDTITITGYTGPGGDVTIPDTINSLPVTSIGNWAFYQCTNLISVAIPNSVTNIGDNAFESCSLTNVTIPNGVTSIGVVAFAGCFSLTSVTIGTNVTSIGDGAFSDCTSLTSVTIPNGVTDIGMQVFYFCDGLTNVMIGNSVTNIGGLTFGFCPSLTAITVDALNSVYSSVDGVLLNKSKNTLIQCPEGKAGNCTIPNSVTSIRDEAFVHCHNLTSITIPNSVTYIGYNAFFYCTGLTSITIPDSITSIEMGAFGDCLSLTSVTIPDSVTRIGDFAFDFCTNLTSVTIPNSVTNIGFCAFQYCYSLTNVTIGNHVTRIEPQAFESCFNLTGVYFQGNAPILGRSDVFNYDTKTTIYYLPGTTGWESFTQLIGPPTVLWNPQVQTGDASFGVRTNQFGFNVTGTTNIPIVLEACTDLANPMWEPLQSCTLTNGLLYFSDPTWTNYPGRFYHIRWP